MVRGGVACARPADVPGGRAQLLRAAAGRRPPRLPAAAPEPLRRRGAPHGARVAVRRRLERRARADPGRGPAPAHLPRPRAGAAGRPVGRRQAPAPGVQATLRAAPGPRLPCLPRAPVRTGARRARLRPRGPRPRRRAAALRQPAQAGAPRPVVRGAPRRRPGGLRPLRGGAGGSRREGVGRSLRGGGCRRRPPAHDPRRQGPRVQGRRGRRRGAQPSARLRHPRALGWALRVQGRPSRHRDPREHRVVPRREGASRTGPSRRSACGSTTSR